MKFRFELFPSHVIPGEVWKPVFSLPEIYASSLGRIYMDNPRARPTYGIWKHSSHSERGAYRRIWRYYGKNVHVSRLVCEAFHGPAPEDAPYCLHIDSNSDNNKPENLKWGTQKENLNHPKFIEYCKTRR